MPNFSRAKPTRIINDYHLYKGNFDDGIPPIFRGCYYRLLNRLITIEKDFINGVFADMDWQLQFPIDLKPLENHLTGYQFNVIGYCWTPPNGEYTRGKGFWRIDKKNPSIINIYYCQLQFPNQARFTIPHEALHFCQTLQPDFISFFENEVYTSILTPALIIKLLEKITEKTTAMYLLPQEYFKAKWQETRSVEELSDYFQVSRQAIDYRLKECNLIA